VPTKASVQKKRVSTVRQHLEVLESGYSEKELNRISEGVTDPDWQTLQVRYGLPNSVREGLNDVINAYWAHRADVAVQKSFPLRIKNCAKETVTLKTSLIALTTDRDFFKGIYAYYDQSPDKQHSFLTEVIDGLQRLEIILKTALVRTANPPHRASHRAIWHSIHLLARILEYQGLELTADQNSIAYPVLYLADTKLEKRQIRTVLKDFVRLRPAWARTDVWAEDKFR